MYDRGKQMRVENYHDEDAAAVAELLSALPELPSTSAESFRGFAAQSYNCGARDFLTLRSGSQLVALLTSTLLPESAPPLRHFRIVVHPGHRRRGVATRLLQALATQSLPAGGRLQSNSQRTWTAGNAFLERYGFEVVQSEALMCLDAPYPHSSPRAQDEIAIRPAMLEDDPAWIALHRLAYQEREDFSELSPGDLRGERACPGFALFVAEEKGQILGYAHVLHLDASEGLINSLVVRESARGRGLGWRLLDRGVDQLWASGVKKISLNVLSDNQHAIDIYDKAGFQSYDEILRYQRREALRLP